MVELTNFRIKQTGDKSFYVEKLVKTTTFFGLLPSRREWVDYSPLTHGYNSLDQAERALNFHLQQIECNKKYPIYHEVHKTYDPVVSFSATEKLFEISKNQNEEE